MEEDGGEYDDGDEDEYEYEYEDGSSERGDSVGDATLVIGEGSA